MDYQRLRAALGNTIRAERYRRGYRSQEAFAYAVGIHPGYAGAVERGERNVSLENLLRISEALEMPLSELIRQAEELAASEGGSRG